MTLSEYVDGLRGKKIDVIGIGVSNIPLIRKLAESGCDVCARDKNPREKIQTADEFEKLGVELRLGEDYLKDLSGDVIFRTPGIRPDLPEISAAVERGAELTSEMEAFFRVCPCTILAVTGSDGKTTTTTLISELLKASGKTVYTGGNIGTPLLCMADEMRREDIVVLELSSFQLMTMTESPHIAVVTNLSPNHLDVHRDYEEYVNAKANILTHQCQEDVAVLNYDNADTVEFAKLTPARNMRYFSMNRPVPEGVYCENEEIFAVKYGKTEKVLNTEDIKLPGRHNIENYMAAYCAVMDVVTPDILKKVAREFGGVEHRIELVRELRGVRYYNDSIASSPSRTIAGLRSFKERVILIAGGKDKGIAYDSIGPEICRHVKKLVLTGMTAEKIKNAVRNCPEYDGTPEIYEAEEFRDAILKASELAEPGDVVILSPASTSFDRFRNFEERGNTFKAIVNEME